MIEGQVVDGLFLRSWARPIELDRANQKRGCVLDLRSPITGGSTIYDVSGQGNHGTITGATWTRLPSGLWAQSFDGTADYVDCGNATNLQMDNNLSALLWINLKRTANYEYLLVKGQAWSNGWWIQKNITSLDIVFNYLGAGGGRTSGILTLTLNLWAFVVFTFASGVITRYLNGTQIGQTTFVDATILGTATSNFYIGIAPDLTFDSQIDAGSYRIFNRVLSDSEIAQIYNQERHLFGV